MTDDRALRNVNISGGSQRRACQGGREDSRGFGREPGDSGCLETKGGIGDDQKDQCYRGQMGGRLEQLIRPRAQVGTKETGQNVIR